MSQSQPSHIPSDVPSHTPADVSSNKPADVASEAASDVGSARTPDTLTGTRVIPSGVAPEAPVSSHPRPLLKTSWLAALASILIVFALVCRFHSLNDKFRWFDEEITAFLISSAKFPDITDQIGVPRAPDYWMSLDRVDPTSSPFQVLHTLSMKVPPDQAPIFYLAERACVQAFGQSNFNLRVIPVISSILALPLIFWLSLELFGSYRCAWLSVAIVAVSPFHFLYAQEARPYMLWLCATLLWMVSIVRSQKDWSVKGWVLSGLAAALAVLTHYPALILVGMIIPAAAALRDRRLLSGLLIALAVSAIVLLPWSLYCHFGFLRSSMEPWLSGSMNPQLYMTLCFEHAGRIFLDVTPQRDFTKLWLNCPLLMLEVMCVALSFQSTRAGGRAIILACVGYILFLLLFDLTAGGRRLVVMRYQAVCLTVMEICVAFALSQLIDRRRFLGTAALSVVIAAGVLSCCRIYNAPEWWPKGMYYRARQLADLLNDRPGAIFMSNNFLDVVVMSMLVHKDVLLEFVTPGHIEIPEGIQTAYLCVTSPELIDSCHGLGWTAVRSDFGDTVWQLEKDESDAKQ